MTASLYLIIALTAGALVAAVVFFLARRSSGSHLQTELVHRMEMIDRGLRDEFSRNREEASAAAKNQREELTKSLESVRSIVDDRLRQWQEDNGTTTNKTRRTGR